MEASLNQRARECWLQKKRLKGKQTKHIQKKRLKVVIAVAFASRDDLSDCLFR